MRIILLFLPLAFTSILAAQASERTCRILFPNASQQPAGKYYLFDGQSCQEVILPRLSFSPVYKLRAGDAKIWLLTSPINEPEQIPPGSPELKVDAVIRDFYMFISTDPDNRVLPLRMRAVNANYDQIRLGEMLWFNLTAKHLAGTIGSSSLKLAPNASALVRQPKTAAGDYPVEIYFRVPNDERTHPLIESQWHHDPRSRSVVFVYDEGRRRAPRIMAFSDFRMTEKKPGQ
jgi:hypothetical protein